MKHLTWLSLVLAFTAHNAMAVTTANCPAALQVKYSQFRIEKSLDQVKAAMNRAGYELDAEEDQALTEAYQNVTGVYLADAPSAIALAVPRPPYTTYEEGGELIFLGKADSTVVTASGQK